MVKGIQKCPSDEGEFIKVFQFLLEQLSNEEMQSFVFVARQIWLRINKHVFGEELSSPTMVKRIAFKQIKLYNSSIQRPSRSIVASMNSPEVKWERPSTGWIKLSWDASLDKHGKRMGVGILVQHQEGRVLAAMQ